MKMLKHGLLAALAIVVASGAGDPSGVLIEVDAGAHERRDTPVAFPLPDGMKQVPYFTLESLDDRKLIPGQLSTGREPEVIWLLRDPLPAGAKRWYRLTPVPDLSKGKAGPLIGRPLASGPAGRGFEIRGLPDVLRLELDGRTVLAYHAAVAEPPEAIDPLYRRSGFIHPLATRSGLVVTDDFAPDHPHQHGLFFAWVNTTYDGRHVDFWNQSGKTGRVSHDRLGEFSGGPLRAAFTATLRHDDLTTPGGPAKVLEETWHVTAYNIPGFVVVDLESRLSCAGDKPLKVNKYHYGGLGLRGNGRWFDPTARGDDPPDPAKSGRSEFLTSEGKRRDDGNHTRPRWADLSGEVDGRMGGLAVLDHPGNFRSPQPVRLHPNKPYFSFAPSVLGDFEIAPGRPYVSRYRLVTHDGAPDHGAIDRLWDDYVDPPRVGLVAADR